MPPRAVVTALLGLTLGGAMPNLALAKPKARPASHQASCAPRFRQKNDREHRAVEVTLESTCDESMQCTVSWQVSCEGGDGPERHEETFDLGAGAARTFVASAAACGDAGFRISPPDWHCKPPRSSTDTAAR